MCDYSLNAVESRDAVVGDKLRTWDFGTGTRGLCPIGSNRPVAVCLRPGTEVGFDEEIKATREGQGHRTAIFRQINKHLERMHHDALELPDGREVLLHFLDVGQTVTVLQLPVAPRNHIEEAEQRRLEVVG